MIFFLLIRFLRLPAQQQRFILEATLWLGLARAAVLALPFRWILYGLGQQAGIATETPQPEQHAVIQQVAWAIRVVSGRTPWLSNCLAQALTGMIMLRRRQVVTTLYLGVLKERENTLAAHAWLQSQTIIVTGAGQLDRYAIVGIFTTKV